MYILNKLLSFPVGFEIFFFPRSLNPLAKKPNALKRFRNGESAETLCIQHVQPNVARSYDGRAPPSTESAGTSVIRGDGGSRRKASFPNAEGATRRGRGTLPVTYGKGVPRSPSLMTCHPINRMATVISPAGIHFPALSDYC